jgi:hypothetical protein
VLELNILEEYVPLNFLTIRVSVGSVLNHVQERNWLFRFLRGLKLFVLFNNSISSLKFGLMSLNLVLREWKTSDLFKDL